MSKRNWKLFVEDILESIGYIEKFTEIVEFEEFRADRKTIDAVVRNFEINLAYYKRRTAGVETTNRANFRQ